MQTRRLILFGALAVAATGLSIPMLRAADRPRGQRGWQLSEAEWRQRLTEPQFRVLRLAETERPFTSPLDREKRAGSFVCAGCALPLFSSKTKYDSGTGWPSFWAPLANAIGTSTDYNIGYPRTEVHCRRCSGHLGHVFDDGPRPTGKRYCMNGAALLFRLA